MTPHAKQSTHDPRARDVPVRPLRRFAILLTALAISVGVASAVLGSSSSPSAVAATHQPTIATAPFAAPTGVTLADTQPPWPLPSDARPYIKAAGLSVLAAEQLAVHYHAHLDIIANGQKVTLAAGVGFVIRNQRATGITVLHTHDTTGVIHIESAKNKPYTLGQVFTEWDVALNANQVGGLEVDDTHVLQAYVNGRLFTGDPATIRLKPHLELALWYGTKGETPTVPKAYNFPAGL